MIHIKSLHFNPVLITCTVEKQLNVIIRDLLAEIRLAPFLGLGATNTTLRKCNKNVVIKKAPGKSQ